MADRQRILVATLLLAIVSAGCTSAQPAPTPTYDPVAAQATINARRAATRDARTKEMAATILPAVSTRRASAATATALSTGAAPTSGAAASPTETPTATAGWGVVNVASLRVRGGPGPAEPVIGSVNQGDRLVILGRNAAGDWLNVRTPGGLTGWVAVQYVAIDGAGSGPGP